MLFAAADEAIIPVIVLAGSALAALTGFVIVLCYHRSLMNAVAACHPSNRAMAPGLVWLNLIPVLRQFWQFWTVAKVGQTLNAEYRDRGDHRRAGGVTAIGMFLHGVGMVTKFGFCCVLLGMMAKSKELAVLAVLATAVSGLATFILFITHWVVLAGHTSAIRAGRRSRSAEGQLAVAMV